MKKCINCGNDIKDDAQFCVNCGTPQPSVQQTIEQPINPAAASSAAVNPTAAYAPQMQSAIGNVSVAEAPKISKEEYNDAKAAYRQARKNAGKSSKPIVVLVIIGILVVAGVAAGLTWYFMSQQQPAPAENTVAQQQPEASSALKSSSDAANSSLVADESNPYAAYIGMWEGKMVTTEGNSKRCYGAENSVMKLDIQSISDIGHVTASIQFLYHGHDRSDESDVATMPGDKDITLTNLSSTFNRDGFVFVSPVGEDEGDEVEIEVTFDENDPAVLNVTVVSHYDGDEIETDTYRLTKNS